MALAFIAVIAVALENDDEVTRDEAGSISEEDNDVGGDENDFLETTRHEDEYESIVADEAKRFFLLGMNTFDRRSIGGKKERIDRVFCFSRCNFLKKIII